MNIFVEVLFDMESEFENNFSLGVGSFYQVKELLVPNKGLNNQDHHQFDP